jgi:hypothetical protein
MEEGRERKESRMMYRIMTLSLWVGGILGLIKKRTDLGSIWKKTPSN